MQTIKVTLWASCALPALIGSTPAWAQAVSAEPAAASNEIGDIVVTAQRREERLQDVPVAITAMTADDLASRRVDNIQGVLSAVPSVSFTTTGGNEARTDFSVRGVANQGGATSPFALYVDEVSFVFSGVGPQLGSVRGFDFNLLDIERVEVLRGPQGTYFGRNALGGAINVVTRKPNDTPSLNLSLDASLEGTDTLRGEGALIKASVNVPLAEGLTIRINGYSEQRGGWIRDIGPAGNTNDVQSAGIRAALRWMPATGTTIDIAGQHSDRRRGINSDIPTGLGLLGLSCRYNSATMITACPLGALSLPTAPVDSGQGFYPANVDRIATDYVSRGRNRTTAVTARFAQQFEPVTLTVVAGYVRNRAYDGGDLDYSPLDYVRSDETNSARGDNYSIEARVASSPVFSDYLRWTIGANYAEEIGGRGLVAFWGTAASVPPPFRNRLLVGLDAEIKTKSTAVFGEVNYDLLRNLTISAGVRYSKDKVATTSTSSSATLGASLNIAPFTVRQDFEDVSPRFNITYKPNRDITVYATASKGYKAGGFNPGLGASVANSVPYEPEILWNYEVGLKSDFLDHRLRANLAVFYMDWKNIQVGVFDAQRVANIVTNAEGASIKGFEAELLFRPATMTRVGLSYSYNDGTYRAFQNCFTIQTTTSPININCTGRRFGNKHIIQVNAEQRITLGQGELYVRTEYNWRSKLHKIDDIQETLDLRSRPFTIAAYDSVNLRLGFGQGPFQIEIYAENIIGSIPAIGDRELFSFVSGEQATLLPRRIGLRVSHGF